jgi:(R)-2-hydroxyacyl-CoA dehydratese activating ATPase
VINIITAGIDTGMETTKAVILRDNKEYFWSVIPGGTESAVLSAESALKQAAEKASIAVKDVEYTIVTGRGKEYITFAQMEVTDSLCLAKGINYLLPSTRTLLDLGSRKSLALKCRDGKVIKLATSNKCAAGTGTYLEMVSNMLRLDIDTMSDMYFTSENKLEIQSLCVVFAESEIISLVHEGVKPEDITRGVFKGLAERIYSQLLELGVESDFSVVGGVARSKAMIHALKELVGINVLVPENPEIVGALGAAIIAHEKRREVQ